MNKSLIPLIAAYVAMTAAHAAEPQVLKPLNLYGAPHARMMQAARGHQSASKLEAADTRDGAEFNVHVALWRSFEVPAGVNGTQPTSINDLGEIAGVYADSNGNIHGFLRKVGGEIVTFDAPNAAGGTFPNDINNEGDVVGSYNDANGASHGFMGVWFDANGAEHGFVALAVP